MGKIKIFIRISKRYIANDINGRRDVLQGEGGQREKNRVWKKKTKKSNTLRLELKLGWEIRISRHLTHNNLTLEGEGEIALEEEGVIKEAEGMASEEEEVEAVGMAIGVDSTLKGVGLVVLVWLEGGEGRFIGEGREKERGTEKEIGKGRGGSITTNDSISLRLAPALTEMNTALETTLAKGMNPHSLWLSPLSHRSSLSLSLPFSLLSILYTISAILSLLPILSHSP
jgi:hypothetical protein